MTILIPGRTKIELELPQSQVLDQRETFLKKEEYEKSILMKKVPRPPYWSGCSYYLMKLNFG